MTMPRSIYLSGSGDRFLATELAHIKIVEDAAGIQQFLKRTSFYNLTILDDQDNIGILDRTQAVRNYETGATCQKFFQSSLDQAFSAGIYTGSSLIENENTWVGKGRPGN